MNKFPQESILWQMISVYLEDLWLWVLALVVL